MSPKRTLLVALVCAGAVGCGGGGGDHDDASPVDSSDAAVVDAADVDAASIDALVIDASPADARPPKPPPVSDPARNLIIFYGDQVPDTLTLVYADTGGVIHALRREVGGWIDIDVTAAAGLDPAAEQVYSFPSIDFWIRAFQPLAILVRFSDGSFTTVREEQDGSWLREDISYLVNAEPATEFVAALSWEDQTESILYLGQDGAVHHLHRDTATGPFTDEVVAGAPVPVGPMETTLYGHGVFAGAGGQPVPFRFTPAPSEPVFDAPLPSTMTGRGIRGFAGTGIEDVAWRDPDGNILAADARGLGAIRDLTTELSLPPADSGLRGDVTDVFDDYELVYRTPTGHVIWVYASGCLCPNPPPGFWITGDATAAAGAPLAVGDPEYQPWRGTIAYLGVDGHVHVLEGGGATWTHTDVTAALP